MLLRDSLYNSLKQQVVTGALAPGQQINEAEVAERFSTSKTPAREALSRLTQENLLSVRPRVGYVVNLCTVEEAQAVFDFRAILEGAAAELAARYVTEGELAQLEEMCELDYHSGEPDTYSDFFDRNRRFHVLVATASRNPYLVSTLDRLFDQINRLLHYRLDQHEATRMATEHRDVVEALRDRDPGAARAAMLGGLDATRDEVLKSLIRRESASIPHAAGGAATSP